MPAESLPSELLEKRRARAAKRAQTTGDLSPLEQRLADAHDEQNEDLIDALYRLDTTISTGFASFAARMVYLLGAVMSGGFILVLVVVYGALQIGGVDITQNVNAVKEVAPLASTTTTETTTETSATTTTTPMALPGAEQPPATPEPTNTSGADHGADAPVVPPAGE